jgi:hypothetical protein
MKLHLASALCALLIISNGHASGLGDPDIDVPRRLVEITYKQDIPANDPRLAKTREQLQQVAKATGETEQGVAQACMRNARYIFDASKTYVSPLEVLEALAKYVPSGKPLTEMTRHYVELRLKQKLGHADALKQLPAGK